MGMAGMAGMAGMGVGMGLSDGGGAAYKTNAINNNYRYNGRNAGTGTGIARLECVV